MSEGSAAVAFTLHSLSMTADPKRVINETKKWSESVGIISNEPLEEILDFVYNNNIQIDFHTGPHSFEETLKQIFFKIATDRHIFIGVDEQEEDLVAEYDWEHLTINEASEKADWEMKAEHQWNKKEHEDSMSQEQTTDLNIMNEESKSDDEFDADLSVSTHRWHEINRENKKWIIRPTTNEISELDISEGDTLLLHRGISEQHQLMVSVKSVREFNDFNEIVDEIDTELIRPNIEEDNIVDVLEKTHKTPDIDTYLAINIEP